VQAKKLKALGFDWECFEWIDGSEWRATGIDLNNEIFPTVALALKWIRDEQDSICHVITQMKHFVLKYKYLYRINYRQEISEQSFINYEAAESALLDELLTILGKERR
jgi:hypothetical protein